MDENQLYNITFPDCRNVELCRARPKSDTFAWSDSDIRIFLAARSLWMTFCDSRYSIPLQASLCMKIKLVLGLTTRCTRYIQKIQFPIILILNSIRITYVANFIWSFFVTYCLPLDLRYSNKLPFDINSVTIFIVRVWLSNTIPKRQTRLSCCNDLKICKNVLCAGWHYFIQKW